MENKKVGRPKIREQQSANKITAEYVVDYYMAALDECGNERDCENNRTTSLRAIARELGISNTKLKKLLITGGVYDFGDSEDMIRRILDYRSEGKTVPEICWITALLFQQRGITSA